jgi:ABC-type branched-subunit amino acid transport system substrate-binding protein/tetratricopeptide (TPR) repeat protein
MSSDARRTLRSARWLAWVAIVAAACGEKVSAPPEPPMSVRRGDQAFRYEEYEAAIDSYRTYLDQTEHGDYTARVLYKAALAEYRLGRYHDTLLTLDELGQRYPKTHWVQVDALRGDAERGLNHRLEALRAWDAAWKVAGDNDRPKLRQRIVSVAHDLNAQDLAKARALVESKDLKVLLDRQIALQESPSIGEPSLDEGAPQAEEEPPKVASAKKPPAAKRTGVAPSKGLPRGLAEPEEAAAAEEPDTGGWEGAKPAETAAAKRKEAAGKQRAAKPAEVAAVAPGMQPEERLGAEGLEPGFASAPREDLAGAPAAAAQVVQGPTKIGCLLPLSGATHEYGERSLRGIRLAWMEASDRLIVKDTASDPATAAAAFEELSRDPSVLFVVGPLRSEEAAEVAPLAEKSQVPLLLLSQRDGLGGPFVLQAGMTRSRQVATLLNYAMDKIRLRNFGVLYPKDAYGEEFRAAFKAEVERRGGMVVGSEAYTPGTHAVGAATVKRWRNAGNLHAVFLPDDAAAAAPIAKFLQREMPDVTLLGVHGWEQLAETGDTTLNGIFFSDGFYTGSARPSTHEFADRFQRTYGDTPGLLEAQAYDAALLAKHALDAGAQSRADALSRLLALGVVPGATGDLLATPGGLEHRMFLLQVYDGKLQEVGTAG